MIDKEKKIYTGSLNDTLTNDNLRKVYGVEIALISSVTKDGRELRSCCLVNTK